MLAGSLPLVAALTLGAVRSGVSTGTLAADTQIAPVLAPNAALVHPRALITPATLSLAKQAAQQHGGELNRLRRFVQNPGACARGECRRSRETWELINRAYLSLIDGTPSWCNGAGKALDVVRQNPTAGVSHGEFMTGWPNPRHLGLALFYDWCSAVPGVQPALLTNAADALRRAYAAGGYPGDGLANWHNVPLSDNDWQAVNNRTIQYTTRGLGAAVLDEAPWPARRNKFLSRLRREAMVLSRDGHWWHEGPHYGSDGTTGFGTVLAMLDPDAYGEMPLLRDHAFFYLTRVRPHALATPTPAGRSRGGVLNIPPWGEIGARSHSLREQCKTAGLARQLVPGEGGRWAQTLYELAECEKALAAYGGTWTNFVLYKGLRPVPEPVPLASLPLATRHGNGFLHARSGWDPDATLVTFNAKEIDVYGHDRKNQTAWTLDKFGPIVLRHLGEKSSDRLSLPQDNGRETRRYRSVRLAWGGIGFGPTLTAETPVNAPGLHREFRFDRAGEITRFEADEPQRVSARTMSVTNAFADPSTGTYITTRTHGRAFFTALDDSPWRAFKGNVGPDGKPNSFVFNTTPEEDSHYGWGSLRIQPSSSPLIVVVQAGDADSFSSPRAVEPWRDGGRQGLSIGGTVVAFDPFEVR